MAIADELIMRVFETALTKFFEVEADALVNDVNEVNSGGRFAIRLQESATAAGLKGYFADPEYNRKQGGEVKTILSRGTRVVRIKADIILHSRGQNILEDNLIAIEMKKSGRPMKEKAADRDRLCAMTKRSFDDIWSNDGTTHPQHVCGYRLGVFIVFNNTLRRARIEFFANGSQVRVRTQSY
jgi:hypothetical protein